MQNEKGGYVYLVENTNSLHVKIGRATNLSARLSGLQVSAADKLELVHAWSVPDCVAVERQMHELFAWAHSRGEWHKANSRDIFDVGNLVVSGRQEEASRLAGAIGDADFLSGELDDLYEQLRQAREREEDALYDDLAHEIHDTWPAFIEAFTRAHILGRPLRNPWDMVFVDYGYRMPSAPP